MTGAGPYPWHLALGTGLTVIAGFVDAIGYSHLRNLYLSFMSGNTTRIGSALATYDVATIEVALGVVATFVLGAGLGALIGDAAAGKRLPVTCAVEVALFGLTFLLSAAGWAPVALMPLSAAMGMQNTLHQHVSGADLGKGFVTGSLVSAGECLARAVRQRGAMRDFLLNISSWLSFLVGVALGAVVLGRYGLDHALLLGALALAFLSVATSRGEWAPPSASTADETRH